MPTFLQYSVLTFRAMSHSGDEIILRLLAQNMAKCGYEKGKNEEEGGSRVKRAKRYNKSFIGTTEKVSAKNEKEIVKIYTTNIKDGKSTEAANLLKALVFNHLQGVSPTLAAEFATTNKFQLSPVTLEKIIEVYSQSDVHDCDQPKVRVDEGRKVKDKRNDVRNSARKGENIKYNKCPETTANLSLSLVYNHLKDVSPKLAAEFSASLKLPHSSVKLKEVIDLYLTTNYNQMNIKTKKATDVKQKVRRIQTGVRRIRFTPHEVLLYSISFL